MLLHHTGPAFGLGVPYLAACCMALLVGSCTVADVGFAQLGYQTRALVQDGSSNLLPALDGAGGPQGWDLRGDAEVIVDEGVACLRMRPAPAERAARGRVVSADARPGVLYCLRFEVKMPPQVQFDWDVPHPGFNGWFSPMQGRQTLSGAVRIDETRRSEEWLAAEYELFTPAGADTISVTFSYNATSGDLLTRKWELLERNVDAAERRVVLQTPTGDWAEATRGHQSAAPAQAVMWAPADVDTLRPYATPSPEDLGRAAVMAGTPGEMCVAAVGIRVPGELRGVRVSCTQLAGNSGPLGAAASCRRVVWQPRRTDFYGHGNTFHHVADFLVDIADGMSVQAGQTAGVWLNLRIPEGARPGAYEGLLHATGDDVDLSVPVRVTVYPFRLQRPSGVSRSLYADAHRWASMSDEQVLAELADFADHGYDSTGIGCRGNAQVQGGHVVAYELAPESERAARLLVRSSLPGPVLVYAENVPDYLANRLGLDRGITGRKADTWPPQLATATFEALRLVKQRFAVLGIADPVMVAVDEPGTWKEGSTERLLWDVAVAREAGWPVFCTSSYPPSVPLGMNLDYHCYGGRSVWTDRQRTTVLARQTRDAGQRMWYYGTGCYSGQVGNVARNRYLGGFFCFRCGADGTASWTFQRPHGNPFDDFAADPRSNRATTGQACITYPHPERPGENLDTPHYEGLRQAYYDHCYAETLRLAIEKARNRDAAAANAAQEKLDSLMECLPWNGPAHLWPQMNNAELSRARAEIAEQITALGGP